MRGMSTRTLERVALCAVLGALGGCKHENPCIRACTTASQATGIDAKDCIDRCTAGKWDETAIACIERAKTPKDATRCDPDQLRKLRKIQRYLERQQQSQ